MAIPATSAPRIILLGTTALYVLALGASFQSGTVSNAVTFSPHGIQNVAQTMAPLFAISAFIERAVEIVIATTRGHDKLVLKRRLDAATTTRDEVLKQELTDLLDTYKYQTQRYSFAVALGLSLFAAVVGVRAIMPLLAPPAAVAAAQAWGAPPNAHAFELFDVIITSLLLAGGCDGIHQVVITITTFLDSSRTSSQQRATPPAPEPTTVVMVAAAAPTTPPACPPTAPPTSM